MEKTFGEWIRARRLEKRLKSYEAADAAGMKKQAWSDYENDRGRNKEERPPEPRMETLTAIAAGLQMPVEEIVSIAHYYYSPKDGSESVARLQYEPADDEDELLSFYRGMPPVLRPGAKDILRKLMEQAQIANEGKPIGYRIKDEEE